MAGSTRWGAQRAALPFRQMSLPQPASHIHGCVESQSTSFLTVKAFHTLPGVQAAAWVAACGGKHSQPRVPYDRGFLDSPSSKCGAAVHAA